MLGNIICGQVSAKKIATLSGDQVVPPVTTDATGHATFKHPDSTTMNYKVNITGITHPTGIGLHEGKIGSNGELIVDLTKHAKNQTTAAGLTITGSFTASDLLGQMHGKTILDLVTVMKSDDTYISVDTQKHPNGEIRGQLELANQQVSSEAGLNQTSNRTTN
jgi:CHRD domain-containing protein